MGSARSIRVPVLLLLLVARAAFPQGVESSFSAVGYDRAATPSTFHGAVEVDAPSGAVAVDLPLGPGIGRGALRFQPRLTGRFAPLVRGLPWMMPGPPDAPPFLWLDNYASFLMEVASFGLSNQVLRLQGGGSASLSPGFFDLLCNPLGGKGGFLSNFRLPDGTAHTLGGSVPAGTSPARVLADFGYPASTRIAGLPGPQGRTMPDFVAAGSGDELVLGLNDPGGDRTWQAVAAQDFFNPLAPVPWWLPARILVVKGALAFEFVFVNPVDTLTTMRLPRTATNGDGKSINPMRFAHYLPSRILDRSGDSIVFSHGGNGIDYTATWTRGGATLAAALLPLDPPQLQGVPCLLDPLLSQHPVQKYGIRISYGGFPQSSYLVEGFPSEYGAGRVRDPRVAADRWGAHGGEGWDALRSHLQPTLVRQEENGEEVRFAYGMAAAGVADGLGGTYLPAVLTAVDLPGRSVAFAWEAYPWRPNLVSSPGTGFVFASDGLLQSPSWVYGVKRIDERAANTTTVRTTLHQRVVPEPDFSPAGGGGWSSTAFYDAIVHPDTSVTAHIFAGPVPGSASIPVGESRERGLQTLAFLKHLVKETRHYPQGAPWASDVRSASPSLAIAHELRDRLELRRATNPGGAFEEGSIPYATRVQRIDRETGTGTWVEQGDWDPAGGGWRREVNRAYQGTSPASLQWVSRAAAGAAGIDAPPCAPGLDRGSERTWRTDLPHWLLGLLEREAPLGERRRAFTYNPDGTVATLTEGQGPAVTTTFQYAGGLPTSALLTGSTGGMGQAGVAEYRYDGAGFRTYIRPSGMAWHAEQTSDLAGRPTSQTDPNGRRTDFLWDGVGRLRSAAPAWGDAPTLVSYHPDNLGATITRGAEWSEHRYDGFGNLVLTRRSDGSARSHKRFIHDAMGRRIYESVWLGGDGSETEPPGVGAGTLWTYDSQGRMNTVTDPNGVLATVSFSGLTRTVTLASGGAEAKSTTFIRDPLGRTAGVIDALGGTTALAYDGPSARLASVVQTGGGLSQVRTWAYEPGMRWLAGLTQPESGTTAYADHTVLGQPRTTITGDGLVLSTAYDDQGRVLQVTSSGGAGNAQGPPAAVSQVFRYDEAGRGASSGRLTTSLDLGRGRVLQELGYGDRAGRLDLLRTTIAGNGTTLPEVYEQAFAYDALGRRTTASLDGRTVRTTFVAATGAPQVVTYTGGRITDRLLGAVTAFDPQSWMPLGYTFGSDAIAIGLTYRRDQSGLASLSHRAQGFSRTWTYTYDRAGRITGDGEDTFVLDPLDRLKRAVLRRIDPAAPPLTQDFTYDPFGNQTSSLTTGAGQPLPVNNFSFSGAQLAQLAATNRLPSMATVAGVEVPTGAQYDGRGNLLQVLQRAGQATGLLTLSYDALGRVTQCGFPGGATEVYVYSAEGLRARVESYLSGVLQSVKHRIYNDQRQLVAEYAASMVP